MFISFDIKFVRCDQKMCRNGEVDTSHSSFLVKPDKLDIKTFTYSMYHAILSEFKPSKFVLET